MTPDDPRPRAGILPWIVIALGGLSWGLAFARTLAFGLRWPFFYGVTGALVGGLFGIAAAVALGRWRVSRLARPAGGWAIAASFAPLYLSLVDLLLAPHQAWRGPVLLAGSAIAAVVSTQVVPRVAWFVLTILLPLTLYLPDISPYVGRADTFEFQVVGPTLGIAHPSGYPLYVLVAKLFSMMPLGSIAWRVNLSSAVFGALASGMLFLALTEGGKDTLMPASGRELAGARPALYPLAWVVALTLAFSPTLWSRAVEAEVYALNAFLVAVGLWLAVHWHQGAGDVRWIWPAFGLLLGVALASHITLGALVFLAASGLVVQRLRPRLGDHRRAWFWAVALGLAGVALYAYIPLRWPAVNGGERMSLAHFVRFVTNAESGGALRPLAFYRDPARWGVVGRLVYQQVGWAGIVLALVGLAHLARRHSALALGTSLACAAWIWFNLSFYVADPDYSAFLIPAHVIIIFWLGWGAMHLGRRVLERHLDLQPILLALLLLLPLSRIWQTGPTLETIKQGKADEAWARYALQQPLETGAAVLADSEKFPPLYYLQQVEGLRPDLEMVTLFNEAQYRQALEARLASGQAVYLARYLPGADLYGVRSEGPLVRVAPEDLRGTPPERAPVFGDALALDVVSSVADPFGRPIHHLTLAWYVLAPVDEDLEVRFRLVDPVERRVLWTAHTGRPVSGYTNTQAWHRGWHVTDYHALAWPAWVAAGTYELEVGLFPRFRDQGLTVSDGGEAWSPVGSVTVPGVAPLPSQAGTVLFNGSIWLSGFRLPGEVAAGSTLHLDLTWRCRAATADVSAPEIVWERLADGDRVAVRGHLMGAGGESAFCGGAVAMLLGRADSPASSPVVRRYGVPAPDQPGRYRAVLRLPMPTGERYPARCRWLAPRSHGCSLDVVTVGPSRSGLANFDNRILLVAADFDAGGVPAGGPLNVDLAWRALQKMERDYTVFLQILGPDGRLYGQVDSWPVHGTRPTSGWRTGERLVDLYRFYVEAEDPASPHPSGTYTVIAGWYLLADMSRLPVVDTDGRIVGDYYTVGTFNIP